VLAGRSEDLDDGAADGIVRLEPAEEQRQSDGGGMRDYVHGGNTVFFDLGLGFDQRSAQAGVGAFFGGAGEVDDDRAGLLVQEFERLAAGFRGSSEEDGARPGEALGVETDDQGRLVADQREFAGLLAGGGNQVEFESGRGVAARSRISRARRDSLR